MSDAPPDDSNGTPPPMAETETGVAFHFCSAEVRSRDRRQLSRRHHRPPGRVSTAITSRKVELSTSKPALRPRVTYGSTCFLSPQERVKLPEARPGIRSADREAPREPKQQGSGWTTGLACAGATNRARMPCETKAHTPPAVAKPSRQQPFLLWRRAQPAVGGIVASMSRPARASFGATRQGVASEES